MARTTRGALPLAVLIAATFIAGVTTAVIRVAEDEAPQVQPTESPSPSPTTSPSPEPTEEPAEEPTEEPTDDGNDDGGNNGNGNNGGENGGRGGLAETGAESLPYLLGGSLMMALAGALWRLSRRPID